MSRLPRPAALRERVVLAVVGLVSAGALAAAALVPWGDPELTGEVELRRRTADAAGLVRLAWDRLLRDPTPPTRGPGREFRWSEAQLVEPTRVTPLDRNRRSGGLVAFNVRLASADEVRTPAEALTVVESALADHPDAERRAEGLLRAVQFAAASGVRTEVQRTYGRLRGELAFEDARGDTSYRLLAALAAAGHLDEEVRATEQGELVASWALGSLALPTVADAWQPEGPEQRWRYRPDPRLELLAERLEGLSPEHAGQAHAAADRDGRRARALRATLGELPAPPADGRWHARALSTDARSEFLLTRRADGGQLRGLIVTPADLLDVLARAVELAPGFGLLPGGEGGASSQHGPQVGEPIELIAGALAAELHHADPGSLVRAEAGRILALRSAFGALAVLSVLATFFTSRALRRERRLARLKSAFVAGVSHDLRTPLASILLMAENLESGRVAGEPARGRYHSAIRREAQRLRRLVEDVLDFSRIERGEGPRLVREEVRLADFLDGLAEEARERVEGAGGTLRIERGELPRSAPLDAEAVRRSVANLVDNALTHSGSTEVTLVARVEDGRFLVLEVSDRGRGVPLARREEIFRPFVHSEGEHAAGGTGLGLAIVREVARAHGGEATVGEGARGVGARFQLRLDLSPGDPVGGDREAG